MTLRLEQYVFVAGMCMTSLMTRLFDVTNGDIPEAEEICNGATESLEGLERSLALGTVYQVDAMKYR